jgi:hypothetical protein
VFVGVISGGGVLDIGGGPSGGTFVGLQPDAARGLAGQMVAGGSEGLCTAGRLAGMLTEAGAEAGGCTTPSTLRTMESWLTRTADDVRWRVELVAADATGGGMRYAMLSFPSAAAARADGRRYANQIAMAMRRYFDADSDEDRAAAQADYLALLRGIGVRSHDPAWAGGLVNRMGHDGIANATFIARFAPEGDLPALRRSLGPLFAALGTAMRHGTSEPSLRRDILKWNDHDLAMVVALAPAETGFLVTVARRVLVAAQTDGDPRTDPREMQYELIFGALADNPAASYGFLTGKDQYGLPAAMHVMPWNLMADQEVSRSLGLVLEAGLVEYPSGKGAAVWNRATAATEVVMHEAGTLGHLLSDADPQLNASLASLLRPHLDAVAAIGARAGGMSVPGGFDIRLPAGRRALDVDAETLRKFLGATMQQDSGIAHVQLLLAAYTQSPQA